MATAAAASGEARGVRVGCPGMDAAFEHAVKDLEARGFLVNGLFT